MKQKKGWLATLLSPLVLLLTLLLLFEEWLWVRLTLLTQLISSMRVFRQVEGWIRGLSPYPSLLILILPTLIILPIKILALYLVAKGHSGWGVLSVVVAKIIGTALVAHFFSLTRERALRIRWFFVLYTQVNRVLAWAKSWLHQNLIYIKTKRLILSAKAWWKRHLSI